MQVTHRSVLRTIQALPPDQTKAVRVLVRRACDTHGLGYFDDDGSRRIIDVALNPWLVRPAQLAFYQRIALTIRSGMQRVLALYLAEPAARELLPLTPFEDDWVRRIGPDAIRAPQTILGRLDSNAFYDDARWRQLQFLEANGVGVGGLHYAPTAQDIVLRHVIGQPGLARIARQVHMGPDARDLLERELATLLTRLRRRGRSVVLLENKDYATGTDEFTSLAENLRRRGWDAQVADPREFELRGGEVVCNGAPVDAVYRDCELREFHEIELQGKHRLMAMQELFRRGQMVSSLTGEFDHKSLWEVFTAPAFRRYFTPAQHRVFQQYLLWTRLLRDARVTDSRGRSVALLPFVRRHKDQLVIKPNRLFGGEGVTLGRLRTATQWERTIAKALRHRDDTYVVQQLARLREDEFPVPTTNGRWDTQRRYVVSGFFVGETGIAFVGRFCSAPVVNVSQGGGLIPVLQLSGP